MRVRFSIFVRRERKVYVQLSDFFLIIHAIRAEKKIIVKVNVFSKMYIYISEENKRIEWLMYYSKRVYMRHTRIMSFAYVHRETYFRVLFFLCVFLMLFHRCAAQAQCPSDINFYVFEKRKRKNTAFVFRCIDRNILRANPLKFVPSEHKINT